MATATASPDSQTPEKARAEGVAAVAAVALLLRRLQSLFDDFVKSVVDTAESLPGVREGIEWTRAQARMVAAIGEAAKRFRSDYGLLLPAAMLEASQGAADVMMAGEEEAGAAPDPNLRATQTRTVKLSNGLALAVLFGRTAAESTMEATIHVWSDGLRLYDRLSNLDTFTRHVVENILRDGIAKGLDAKTLAANLRRGLAQQGVLTPEYAARRLAVTEIANAQRRAAVRSAIDPRTGALKPYILGLKWSLSAAHSVVDECDDYAAGSSEGLPEGIYLPADVPQSHPNCQCELSPVLVNE